MDLLGLWEISKRKVHLSVPVTFPTWPVFTWECTMLDSNDYLFKKIVIDDHICVFTLQDNPKGALEDPQWRETSPL